MRLTGAFAGGALGIASLIFILPSIDSITGISLLLAAGTALSGVVLDRKSAHQLFRYPDGARVLLDRAAGIQRRHFA